MEPPSDGMVVQMGAWLDGAAISIVSPSDGVVWCRRDHGASKPPSSSDDAMEPRMVWFGWDCRHVTIHAAINMPSSMEP